MDDNVLWRRRLSQLRMQDILKAVEPHRVSRRSKRNKELLISEVALLEGEALERLVRAVENKENGTTATYPDTNEWSLQLKRLTKKDLAEVLRPFGLFTGSLPHMTKDAMVNTAVDLGEEMRHVLEEFIREKNTRRGNTTFTNHHAREEEEEEEEEDGEGLERDTRTTSQRVLAAIEAYNPDISHFMDLPDDEDIRYRHQLYIDATSNEALAHEVCVSCAREVWRNQTREVLLRDLPSRERLRPWKAHASHILEDGMLLVSEKLCHGEEGTSGAFCDDCIRDLQRNRRPPLSLGNNMWIGNVPDVMSCLTIPEQMLIALHYPRCFVFKLFPKNGGSRDPETLQRGMVGNVTTYAMNSGDIVRMLEGKLMPRPPELLASVIAVSFIGLGKLPKRWLKGTFRVRRAMVHDALRWLKANNEMYEDIDISVEALQVLPEDGVPNEILANVRHEESDSIAEQERASYVPGEANDGGSGGPVLSEPGRHTELDEDNEDDQCKLIVRSTQSRKLKWLTASSNLSDGDPVVIPLQALGTLDLDMNNLSANELMMWALANSAAGKEGGYANRYSRDAVNMFGRPRERDLDTESLNHPRRNPLAAAYPTLFPYGVGGIEADRETDVGIAEHVKWALQYYDRRFRTHHSFPFVTIGIIQRREIMRSARLQMQKHSFLRDANTLSTITNEDVRKALKELDTNPNQPVSDSRIRLLNKLVFGCGAKVMGSNESRTQYRQDIWSTSVYKRPQNIWFTVNPADGHDPMVQLFAGEQIDMDRFNKLSGPDAHKRARNVAYDPYAAAKYFNYVVKLILEKLFGIRSANGRVTTEMGLLGRLSAYFGVVEAQGRGTLHLHMFLWLEDSPSSDEMLELLENSEEFRAKIQNYIAANIRADVPGLSSKEEIQAMPREADLAYSRPPNPAHETYEEEKKDTLVRAVRSQQIHTCTVSTCLVKQRNGTISCKRRAPFPLADEAYMHANGEWGPRRLFGYVNTFQPNCIIVIKCNQDIKLVIFGRDTRHSGWYMTNYGTKNQNRFFNYSAFVARGLLYDLQRGSEKYFNDLRERGRLLLIRCANSVNNEQELSAPQVISYLMGWGDVYRSHNYVPLYWGVFARELRRTFNEFSRRLTQ